MRKIREPLTIATGIDLVQKQLGNENAHGYLTALSIVRGIIGLSRTEILSSLDNTLSPIQENILKISVSKVKDRFPLAYINHIKEFYALEFAVNEHVLIPRPETELLVDLVLGHLNTPPQSTQIAAPTKKHLRLLEVGTGSGCIVVSIAKNLNFASHRLELSATDVSAEALKLAKLNSKKLLAVNRKIKFSQHNILNQQLLGEFDIIVSNPPYIPNTEYINLDTPLFYEPKLALTDGKDGLSFYRRFAQLLDKTLAENGVAYFEIHAHKSDEVQEIFKTGVRRLKNLTIHRDLAKKPRAIEIRVK